MERKIFLAMVLLLSLAVLFVSGCTSDNSYEYRGGNGGAAPVGGGCGVTMPSDDIPSKENLDGLQKTTL